MRRTQVIWAVIFGLFFAAFVATVAALNAGLYSAHGFVRSYLEAVARHDTIAALETPGIPATVEGVADDLLVPEALGARGSLADIRLIDDVTEGTARRVSYTFELDGSPATASYLVERNGTVFGLFSRWRFVESPLATIPVTVLHARTFEANGVTATTETPNRAADYRVFTPARYAFTHNSTFLESPTQQIDIPDAAAATSVSVNVRASAAFIDELNTQVHAFLDDCAKQRVLMPTGCPLGFAVSDRITEAPTWSIAEYPEVRIEPGSEVGSWIMPPTLGSARIVVGARSLFDGSEYTIDEDSTFTLGYQLTITPDDELVATVLLE